MSTEAQEQAELAKRFACTQIPVGSASAHYIIRLSQRECELIHSALLEASVKVEDGARLP